MKRTFRGMSLVMMVLVTACGGGVRPEGSQPEVPQAGILVQHAHRTAVLLTAMDQAGHGMASMDETGEVCLWDGDGRIQARIPGQGGEGSALAFSPDGSLLAIAWRDVLSFTQRVAVYRIGGRQDNASVWIRTHPVSMLQAQVPQAVTAMDWNPAGTTLALVARDGVRTWNVGTQELVALKIPGWNERNCVALAFAGPGSFLVADEAGTVTVIPATGAIRERVVSSGLGPVTALAGGTDGEILIGHASGRIRVIGAGDGQMRDLFLGGTIAGFVRQGLARDALVFDGRRALLLTIAGAKRMERILPGQVRGERAVSIRADGLLCVGYTDGGLGVWRSDGTLRPVPTLSPAITALAVSTGGILSVGTSAGRLLTLGRKLETIRWAAAHDGLVRSLAWRPAGDLLLSTGYEGRVVLWNQSGVALRAATAHREAANRGVWSRDGQRYATAGTWDKSIHITQVSGYREALLTGHFEAVMALAFAPSGEILASAANDSTIRLWTRGANPGLWTERTIDRMSGVETLMWNADGSELLAAGYDGVRRIRVSDGHGGNLLAGERAGAAVYAGESIYAALASGAIVRWPDAKRWSTPLTRLGVLADASALAGAAPGRLIVAGAEDGKLVLVDTLRDTRLFVQLFADGRMLMWNEAGAWDGDPVLVGERLTRLYSTGSREPGLAARFMADARRAD